MKISEQFTTIRQKIILTTAILAAILLTFSINVEAQKRMKTNNWTNAFPSFPDYRRSVEKPFFEDGKLYYQTAKYRNPKDKSDYFEILLQRHPNVSAERYAAPSDWIKHLSIGGYRVYQIFPTCGLDFYKYSLEVFPDENTSVMLKLKDDSKTDLIALAAHINFGQIAKKMKAGRNVYSP